MKSNPVLPVDVASFENSCGIGVNITPDQIEDCVSTMHYLWVRDCCECFVYKYTHVLAAQ